MTTRRLARDLLPPILVRMASAATGRRSSFVPAPRGWEQASARSVGYTSEAIVERVAAATRDVVAGRAAFERDSVRFAEPEHRYPLLASLLHAAARSEGRLHVLDFGGALGSLYWQHRAAFEGLAELRWVVVEQPAFVELGRREFEGGPLSFAMTVEEAAARLHSPVVLASSVLQYLAAPQEMLKRLGALQAAALLIDRTPVSQDDADRVYVQRVPRRIYDASYPSWVFSRARLLSSLHEQWSLRWLLPCDEGPQRAVDGLHFEYEGFYLGRRT